MGGSGQREQLAHWAQRESPAGLEVEGALQAQLTINELQVCQVGRGRRQTGAWRGGRGHASSHTQAASAIAYEQPIFR